MLNLFGELKCRLCGAAIGVNRVCHKCERGQSKPMTYRETSEAWWDRMARVCGLSDYKELEKRYGNPEK